ncbi:MurR/RpiR family transcriptional regulator [Anaeroselena agilis]|uniref:MurR/RpiR family transcriptional regulator n=1 Tax=Anaeroselena agilis TaxID=3063788 RepID=A0ABU3NTQ6_9FIRM|nr:MurR/RpiR family transcriptional regulator [Selenomonadales bacterium 4137-cl]
MDLFEDIRGKIASLPRSQRKVAQHIMDNWERVAYESSTAVARQLNLSQATIIRTACALGFAGFPELQGHLRDIIQQRVSLVGRLDQVVNRFGKEQEQGEPSTKDRVFRQMAGNLRTLYTATSEDQLCRAVDSLMTAERVFIVGMRSSSAIAAYLGFNLSMVRPNVIIQDNDYNLLEKMKSLSADDLIVAIVFPRYTRLAIEATRKAYLLGARVIGITDSAASPIGALCHQSFYLPATSTHYNHSAIAAIALVDALLSFLSVRYADSVRKELELIEQDFKNFNIFEK